jgi:hypothetical protein
MSESHYYKKYLKYKSKYTYLKQIGGERLCTPEELMTLPNHDTECKNVTKVVGSCSHPTFKQGKESIITDPEKEQLLQIFSFFDEKVQEIHIILGATTNFKTDFKINNDNYVCLFFDPNSTGYTDTIDKIKFPENRDFKFKLSFPLNFTDPNSKEVLDKLIEIKNKGKKIYLTNRMCGTCFPSFYYLVKNGIEYKVAPEQGIDKEDTKEIQECFDPQIYTYKKTRNQLYSININTDEIITE